MSRHVANQLVQEIADVRADYTAGQSDRRRRRRRGLGGSGDAHYGSDAQFAQIREYTRDMDRNDGLVGPIVDRATTSQIQEHGFTVEPDTGDISLDIAIKDRWVDWSEDKLQCDHHAERTLWQMCWYALRQTYIDGDMFAVLPSNGTIQLIESDRCVTPQGSGPNVVHGVELAGRRKIAYHFGEDPGTSRSALRGVNTRRVHRFDEHDLEQVLQIYNPQTVKRITQTRGLSAFAPVFFRCEMYEDKQMALLVQQLAAATIALFIERSSDYMAGTATFGPRREESDGANTRDVEALQPGMVVRGAKGEKPHLLSATNPTGDAQAHSKQILREISVTLGVPLVLAMMDASETNFSGWRGAMDMARMGFRVNQCWYISSFMRPVYRRRLALWIEEGEFGMAAKRIPLERVLRHAWGRPSWPYVQPLQDAQADSHRLQTGQLAPSRWAMDRGLDWEDHVDETVRCWGYAIRAAKTAADEINDAFPDQAPIHWRELLNMAMPKGMTISTSKQETEENVGA
ncbi:MAG: phage portal protein [Pirellulales bacterium]|nr:phage portal protein [Pirellulales bacterium]